MENSDVMVSKKQVLILGIVLGLFVPPLIGLVYGVPLLFKQNLRNVGYLVIGWSVIWSFFSYLFIAQLLKSSYIGTLVI